MGDFASSLDATVVPLFPLPNVVLFPRAVLPLHIFEERYKAMTADVLAGNRQIAMALLRPGWEKSYYGRAEIEPVICVGTILSHERLPDGRYNFLLQGNMRATVVREVKSDQRPYRVAHVVPVVEVGVLEIDLGPLRQRMVEIFTNESLSQSGLAPQFRKLLHGPWPTADIADLLAFSYFEDPRVKQELLADGDVARRARRTVSELESLAAQAPQGPSSGALGGAWHPPSLN